MVERLKIEFKMKESLWKVVLRSVDVIVGYERQFDVVLM